MSADIERRIGRLAQVLSAHLAGGIMPFWLRLEDPVHGGHYGRVDLSGRIDRRAPKPAVYVARLLWTLSEVGRARSDEACLAQAARTKQFLLDRLRDPEHGGLFWSVTADGRPRSTDKHVYAQAFGIYGLSAHAVALGDAGSLAAARELFALLEARARQADGTYAEAFDRAWQPIKNQRLAPGGDIGTRTANAHLHLIEAYTALLRARPDAAPRAALRDLLSLFLERFVAADGTHTHQFLNARLEPQPGPISCGHDIEASWLIEAAGDALGDASLSDRLRAASAQLAAGAASHGQGSDGGWFTAAGGERGTGGDRVSWVQAEAVVGLVNAAVRGGKSEFMDRAEATWAFVERVMIDRAGGDWFEAVDGENRPLPERPKAGPWKDPYHPARACLEIARRAQGQEASRRAEIRSR